MNRARLKRLEAIETKARPPVDEGPTAPWEFLILPELLRLRDGDECGRLSSEEFCRWVAEAHARAASGLSREEICARQGKEFALKQAELTRLHCSLFRRHRIGCGDALDVLDLDLAEIALLADMGEHAKRRADFLIAASAIGRLRCYFLPMTVDEFAALVLDGVMPAKRHQTCAYIS